MLSLEKSKPSSTATAIPSSRALSHASAKPDETSKLRGARTLAECPDACITPGLAKGTSRKEAAGSDTADGWPPSVSEGGGGGGGRGRGGGRPFATSKGLSNGDGVPAGMYSMARKMANASAVAAVRRRESRTCEGV